MAELGIDRVILVRFNDAMRNMEATEFIEEVFVKHLNAQHIVVGDDLRFGRDGGGDFDYWPIWRESIILRLKILPH